MNDIINSPSLRLENFYLYFLDIVISQSQGMDNVRNG